ncbi:MAG: hypothetical protein ACLUFV_12400 [Acutalibacteraceae bacterium]
MNSIPALFAYIESQAPRFQTFLERLTAQESFSADREDVSRAADLTADFARSLGFAVEAHAFRAPEKRWSSPVGRTPRRRRSASWLIWTPFIPRAAS